MLFVLAWVTLVTCLQGWCASVEDVAVVLAWGVGGVGGGGGYASMGVVGGILA